MQGDLEIRAWSAAADPLLDALRGEPWLDFSPECIRARGLQSPGRTAVVAWTAGVPRGLAILDEACGEIELTLAVDPALRRRGVARALLDRARLIADLKGLELWARVEPANEAARAFFTAAGAREARPTEGVPGAGARFVL